MPTTRTTRIVLAVLVLAGAVLRAVEAASPASGDQSADELSYQRLAIDVATGDTYGEGLSSPLHWPPGVIWLYALAYRIDPDPALPAAYWLQALVGTLTIVIVFALAHRLAGRAAGLAAAAIVAFYPPYLALTGQLLSETLGTLLLACAALATVVAWRPRSDAEEGEGAPAAWPWFAAAGVLWALAILTRANYVFVPLVIATLMALAAFARGRDVRLAARTGGVLLLATIAGLAPWVAWASDRAGKFVLVTEGDASAMFVGTYLPGGGTTSGMKDILGPPTQDRLPQYADTPVREIPAAVVLNTVRFRHPRLDREDAIRREVRRNLRRYAVGQPLSFAWMMVKKTGRTWMMSSRVGQEGVSWWVRGFHGTVVALSLILAIVALWRRRDLRLAILLSVPLYSALLHAVLVAKPRYNLPPFALLVACGCVAAAWLWADRRARQAEPGRAPST